MVARQLIGHSLLPSNLAGQKCVQEDKLALIDVIKYDAPNDKSFVWKHPSDAIRLGSQLVVGEGQTAVFVKGGQALDVFDPGTHTLSTGNIPLLDKLISIPFGGNTPFTASVWFVSTTVKRDLKWGTTAPIPLMDSTIGFPVSARGFGKWGVRIADPKSFVAQIVGTQSFADDTKIYDYFIGEIVQVLVKYLSSIIARGEASILQVSALVSEISEPASEVIQKEFDKYGLELVNFNIESINIPEEELKKIQDIYAKSLEARELSKVDVGSGFAAIKSFEVLNNAANNTSDGALGNFLGAGLGLGAGLPLGQQLGQQMTTTSTSSSQTGAEQSGDHITRLKQIKEMFEEGLITQQQYDQKRDEILKDL